jgi:hypothetical protein
MDKVKEIMGLINERVDASYSIFSAVGPEDGREAIDRAVAISEAIEAALRKLVEREPLSDEQISDATRCDIADPVFLIAKGFIQAAERAHGIGVK